MTDLLERSAEDSERPRIDPRIAQRWIDARREEGRRRLHVLVAAGVVAACAVAAFGSLYTPIFRVRHIRISVTGSVSAQTVGRLAGVTTRTQTIDVNTGAVAARLDAYPSLGAARVSRHWPGTVTISVSARNPIAVAATPSGFAEVDQTGRVLADVAAAPPGMPQLLGLRSVPQPGSWLGGSPGPAAAPDSSSAGLVDMAAQPAGSDVPAGPAAALAFLDALPPLLRADVISMTTAGPTGLSLVVSPPRLPSGNVTVVLGDGSRLQAKVTALVTFLDDGNLSGAAALDLTVPTRPATASTVSGLSPAPPASSTPSTPSTPSAPSGSGSPTTGSGSGSAAAAAGSASAAGSATTAGGAGPSASAAAGSGSSGSGSSGSAPSGSAGSGNGTTPAMTAGGAGGANG